jgi:hypothetical protein
MNFAIKKKPNRERLLDLLSDKQWHSFMECKAAGGLRYGARILELKRLGYVIESRGKRADGYEYRLTGMGMPQTKRVKVLLSESDVISLIENTNIPPTALTALEKALHSFQVNKEKL